MDKDDLLALAMGTIGIARPTPTTWGTFGSPGNVSRFRWGWRDENLYELFAIEVSFHPDQLKDLGAQYELYVAPENITIRKGGMRITLATKEDVELIGALSFDAHAGPGKPSAINKLYQLLDSAVARSLLPV